MAQAAQEQKKNENHASIPKRMKAIRLHAYNDDMTKAIKLEECDVPVANDNEILVKVYSVSLNPVDWKQQWVNWLQFLNKRTVHFFQDHD